MTSFIIAGRDKQKRIAFAQAFCAKRMIDQFDITLIEKDTLIETKASASPRQSIGIDAIKRIQKTVFLKPIKSDFKAVIVEDAHLLTTEAQNAFLKVLEEPPEHTLILLGVTSKEALLPTIRSRCQIIELESAGVELTTREKNSVTQFIEELPAMTVGEKLKKAELLAKDKDKAVDWVEKVIIVLRQRTLESLESQTIEDNVNSLRKLQTLYTLLKTTNVNPRFAIETTLLSLA